MIVEKLEIEDVISVEMRQPKKEGILVHIEVVEDWR